MPGRRVSHSEARWQQLTPTIVRCNGTLQSGKRCRREAIEGSVVCEIHGGLAPQVRRRAAERVLLTADEAIQVIKSFISDPTVPAGVRLKAAQDLADRAGLAAAQVHKIVPSRGPGACVLRGHPRAGRSDGPGGAGRPARAAARARVARPRYIWPKPRYYEEDHEDGEVTMPETESEPERQHSDVPPRLFPQSTAPKRRRPR